MGFWGKLGKIALKAAPIAASFIPGVGPLASMAIGGLSNAASKKLEGGSWKQALGAGAMGAGTSALSSAIGGGFAKTPAGMTKAPLSALQKVGKGVTAGLGGLGIVQEELANRGQSSKANESSSTGGGIGPSSTSSSSNRNSNTNRNGLFRGGPQGRYEGPAALTNRGSGPRGLPYGLGAGQTPDLSSAFARGRNTAIMNQPFRAGAPPFQRMNDETGMMEDIPGDTGRPPIYPNAQEENDMFGSALGGMMGAMGGGQRRPPMQGGGGIGPSQPPMGGGMMQTHVMRPPSGRNMSGGPGPVLNRPMQPGSQMGRAMSNGGQPPSLGMGMGGGSQFRPPGMPQFNPGMSMRPAVMPQGAQRATDGGMQTSNGIGPSMAPNDPNNPQYRQNLQNHMNQGLQAGANMNWMTEPGGPMAMQSMENDPNAPPMGQKIDMEKQANDMGMMGPGIGPSDQMQQQKAAMMQQKPPMMPNRMNQQPGMSYLMGRGGMNRNMPMGRMY